MNEKKDAVKQLKDELFYEKKNGRKLVSDDVLKAGDEFCADYCKFLGKAKTERLAVRETLALAAKKGFTEFDPDKKYKAGDKVYVNNHGKSVILAVIGKRPLKEGVKITASHIDSPRLDLKPNPLYESNDLAYFKTHYYGGIKKYQWATIPLSLYGVVVKRDGSRVEISIGDSEGDPCFVVSDLLPHLAAEQSKRTLSDGIKGEELNILIGSHPFKADEGADLVKLNIIKILNEKYGITEGDFLSAELEAVPSYMPRDVGFDRSLIGAYGHDDRVCAYPALRAVLDVENPEKTVLTVLADKEEIGSDGNTGLNSSFLKYFIEDLAVAEGLTAGRVLRVSKCLSADVNSAYDPTFSDVFEPKNSSFLNGGAVITKYTGARGKSGTSDASAEYVGEIRKMLCDADIIWQTGELGKVDAGGGGTVAMFIANLGVDTVDLGVPVLAMHAPFEIVAKFDVYMTYLTVLEFYKTL